MTDQSPRWKSGLMILLVVALAAWPATAISGLLLSYFNGEGSILSALYLEPKRKLLAEFLHAYRSSLPYAAIPAALVAISHALLSRWRWGIALTAALLPATGVAGAVLIKHDAVSALTTGLLAGALVMLAYLMVTGVLSLFMSNRPPENMQLATPESASRPAVGDTQ